MAGYGYGYFQGGVPIGSNVNPNEPEVDLYITGLVTPLSAGQITKLNALVRALKTGLSITNLSDAFDVLYVLGGETAESSLKNIVKNAHHATAVNSPTFTQLEGFKGNGTSAYINTSYNSKTHGVNYSLNNAANGIYIRTNISELKVDFGCREVNNRNDISSKGYNSLTTGAINSVNIITDPVGNLTSEGLTILTRNGSIAESAFMYRNKTTVNTGGLGGVESAAIPNGSVYILARNTDGMANLFSTQQISVAFSGKHITIGARDVITDAIEAYMDSNGKGVIA